MTSVAAGGKTARFGLGVRGSLVRIQSSRSGRPPKRRSREGGLREGVKADCGVLSAPTKGKNHGHARLVPVPGSGERPRQSERAWVLKNTRFPVATIFKNIEA